MSAPSSFLTPPGPRPGMKRLHSLGTPRAHPYCPASPTSPYLSPTLTHNPFSGSSSTPCTPSVGPACPKRPGAPKRAHSFCASSPNTSFALASTSAGAHLSHNKRELVALPLERTLSSFGHQGNVSPPEWRMERPKRTPLAPLDTNELSYAISPLPTPPTSPVPRIIVSSSHTPPRPALNPHASYSSSRSASYNTVIATPTSPDVNSLLFARIIEDEEALSESPTKAAGPSTPTIEMERLVV